MMENDKIFLFKSQIMILGVFPLTTLDEFIVSNPNSKLISKNLIMKSVPFYLRYFCTLKWIQICPDSLE